MSEPRRHHYIPRFYLACWQGAGGRLTYYKWVQHQVVTHEVHPKSTAFERDLYALAHLPAEIQQDFEKYVTADVDDRAAKAMQKMRSGGVKDLSDSERLAWSQFLVSLPIRNPDAVADIKEDSSKTALRRAFEEASRQHPEWAGEQGFEREFAEAVEADPATAFLSHNYGLFVIGNLMLNPDFQEPLLGMHWWTLDFSKADFSLLTSDRPYTLFRNLAHPRCLVYVPIGPHLAFFASPDPDKQKQLQRQDLNHLSKRLNGFQVDLAVRFVYAADSRQRRFIENRWSRL